MLINNVLIPNVDSICFLGYVIFDLFYLKKSFKLPSIYIILRFILLSVIATFPGPGLTNQTCNQFLGYKNEQ